MSSTNRQGRLTLRVAVGFGLWIAASMSVAGPAEDASTPSPATPSAPTAEESGALGEIIVTARKREERAIDIPESLTVLSSADLDTKGIETIEDLGRQTPNLQLNMRQDLTTDVVIRGVGAFGDVLGVGFNIDDVPNFTDQTMRLEDLESVEILKGPQGTLFGGSAIGGLIRYVSKKPSFDWSGEVSAEVGSFDTTNLFVAQNVPLIPDRLALRISAYDVHGDGYIRNSALGIPGNPMDDYGTRMLLLWDPNDSFSALLTLRHSFIRNGADEYAPIPSVNSYTDIINFYQPTSNTRSTYGAVLELNDEMGPMKLTSISSATSAQYSQNNDTSFTPPGVPGLTQLTLPGNRPTQVATQELRITSPSGTHFEWLAGLYGAVIENVLLNLNAVADYPPPPMTTIINNFDTKRTDTAAFANATFREGPWSLETGARLAETRFRANVFVEIGGLPDQSGEITSRAVLPRVSLSYALPGDEHLYATVAKGMEPGAVNAVSTTPLPYRSETALSYEVGIKGEPLERRIEYETAVFFVENHDHQYETNQFIPAEGGLITLISNIGDSRTFGLESSIKWRVMPEVTLSASGGYLNAKWQSATVFDEPINGNTIPNAPAVTADVGATYSRPVLTNLRFEGSFDMSYTDAMWWDLPNTPGSEEHPHWLGSLRTALGTDGRGWQVAFKITNILGAKYWTEFFPAFFGPGANPCPGCSNIGAPGAPRTYLLSLSYRY